MNKEKKIYEWSDYLILPYFSKSYSILYPLLGFNKNEKYEPESSYLFWEGEESILNYELLVYYENPDEGFENFEKNRILTNDMLKTCYSVENGMLYVFDMISQSDNIFLFLEGKYSKMSEGAKKIIRKFHGDFYTGNEPKKGHPFHTILFPKLYEKLFQEELDVKLSSLRAHGEAWDLYSTEKETFQGHVLNDCECINIKRITYNI